MTTTSQPRPGEHAYNRLNLTYARVQLRNLRDAADRHRQVDPELADRVHRLAEGALYHAERLELLLAYRLIDTAADATRAADGALTEPTLRAWRATELAACDHYGTDLVYAANPR